MIVLSIRRNKNYNNYKWNIYDVLRIRRSAKVSAKAGYLQFVPSGGFEAMNDGTDFDTQWDNYSISKVIFRELLEECFGIDEDDKAFSSNTVSPDRIYHNVYINKLIEMLIDENPKAFLEFVGTSMSLVGLRQELCFVMRIDDSSFANQLTSNYESKAAIHLIDIHELEKEEFWIRDKSNDLEVLNCTSAGLLELAKNSKLYKEAIGI